MTKYLISFPADAMQLSPEELGAAAVDAHAVIEAAKAAGVYVFAGGVDEGLAPVRVAADGTASTTLYPGSG